MSVGIVQSDHCHFLSWVTGSEDLRGSPTPREMCCHLEAKFSTSQGPQRHPLNMCPSYQGTCPSDPGDPSLHTRTGLARGLQSQSGCADPCKTWSRHGR